MQSGRTSGGQTRKPSAQRRQRPASTGVPSQANGAGHDGRVAPAGQARREHLAAVGILGLALALRVLGLGSHPLQPGEAANAWESWSLAQGASGSAAAGPLLVYGNALVFFLFGANDASARLLPALAGTAMVALPLILQRELGRFGSRVAMLLLAISPTLVYYSRQADPPILAAAAALSLVAFGAAAYRDGDRRALYAAAASAALLLLAGPPAYYFVGALLAYAFLRVSAGGTRPPASVRRVGVAAPGPGLAGAGILPSALRDRATLVRAGLALGATWLVVTTGFLTNLHGVQEGVFDGVDGWLRSLTTPTGQSPFLYAAILATYELPSLVFGLIGAGSFARRPGILPGVLTWWALAVLVLGSFGAERPAGVAALLVPPLALLAGGLVDGVARDLAERRFRVDLGWFALGGTIILAGFGIALNHLSYPEPYVPDIILAIPVGLLGAGLSAAVQAHGPRRTLRLLLAFGFAVLVVLNWRASTTVSQQAAANPADLFVGAGTSPDVRTLASDTSQVVNVLGLNGRPQQVVVARELAEPLRWYLRGLPEVTVGDASGGPAIVILPAGARAPVGTYAGQRYRVLSVSRPAPGNWKELWRWVAFHESVGPPLAVDAVVYVKKSP